MIQTSEATGVILAGGKSTRMGANKALLVLNEKPLIQHVAEVFQFVFAEVFVSANTAEYDFLGLPVLRDVYPECGPLGGIHAALGSVKTQYAFVAPCDIPFFVPAMVEELLAGAVPDHITIAATADRLHSLVGVYPTSCRLAMCEFISSGQRKVKDFLVNRTYCTVCLDAWSEGLENINDVEHYRRLLR